MTQPAKTPAPDRQKLFQYRYFCRPKPSHPSFFELERIELIVWIYDEDHESAAKRATIFVSAFPVTIPEKVIGQEITELMLQDGSLEPWQIDNCVKAHEFGIQFGYFKRQGDEESHRWPK